MCYPNACQLRLCVALIHFPRGQGFSATVEAALIFSVPLPHLAWTARPSTLDFEFGWTKLHVLEFRNFCRQIPNQILLLDEPALRAGGISFGLDVHDVVASPLREAVDAVNEGALLGHDDFTLPARLPSVSCRRAERQIVNGAGDCRASIP
jgi:hypothetical protein